MVKNMVRKLKACWCLVALAALAGCSNTELTRSWSPPDAEPLTFKKVIVIGIAKDPLACRAAEDAMVKEIHRAAATPAYRFISDAELRDTQKVRDRVVSGGFDGAITMRLVGVRQESGWIPDSPDYSRFGGYHGRSWSNAYDSGRTVVSNVIQIETNIYSVKDWKLVWAGISETFDPATVELLVEDLAVQIVRDLRKKGLIPPKTKDIDKK
jgi:hypothetical protein